MESRERKRKREREKRRERPKESSTSLIMRSYFSALAAVIALVDHALTHDCTKFDLAMGRRVSTGYLGY